MKRYFPKLIIFGLVLVIILGMSGLALADGNLGDDVVKALKSKDKGLMGDGAMSSIEKGSRDVFNIVRYFVIASLMITAFALFSQFSKAGDDPRLKASLKAKLAWTAGGLVLALNFWYIYSFVSKIVIDLST